MFEALLSGKGTPIPPETGDVIFYVDMATLTETIRGHAVSVANGAVVDNTFLIDGKPTLKMPTAGGTTGSRLRVSLSPALDLSGTNWTIEWSTYYVTAPGTWANDFYLTESTYYKGVMSRFADSGWNGLMMFADNSTNNVSTARVNLSPGALAGQLHRYAITCRAGRIRYYINGQLVGMRAGTNSNPGAFGEYFDVQTVNNFANLTQLNIGGFAGAAVNTSRYIGNVRISNFVRYNGNYTPVPF
ncbi:hypothetical protein [Pseudomonas phage D6]|nr:hypothetical protein [Pseudomonas phage D6]